MQSANNNTTFPVSSLEFIGMIKVFLLFKTLLAYLYMKVTLLLTQRQKKGIIYYQLNQLPYWKYPITWNTELTFLCMVSTLLITFLIFTAASNNLRTIVRLYGKNKISHRDISREIFLQSLVNFPLKQENSFFYLGKLVHYEKSYQKKLGF